MYLNKCLAYFVAGGLYPVGISDGRVVDGQLNASTSYYYGTPAESRLNQKIYTIGSTQGCWRPRANKNTEYISVDLLVKHEIGELILQGSANYAYFVKQYLLSYSDDGVNFKYYTGTGNTKKVGVLATYFNFILNFFYLYLVAMVFHITLWTQFQHPYPYCF